MSFKAENYILICLTVNIPDIIPVTYQEEEGYQPQPPSRCLIDNSQHFKEIKSSSFFQIPTLTQLMRENLKTWGSVFRFINYSSFCVFVCFVSHILYIVFYSNFIFYEFHEIVFQLNE